MGEKESQSVLKGGGKRKEKHEGISGRVAKREREKE